MCDDHGFICWLTLPFSFVFMFMLVDSFTNWIHDYQVFSALVGTVRNAPDGAGDVPAHRLRDAHDDRSANWWLIRHHRGVRLGWLHHLPGEYPSVVDLGVLDIWGYWISPLTYAQNAIAANEFLADRWNKV